MAKKLDILWKGILEDVLDDFLCFIHPGAEEIFNFNKGFQFLDKELEQVFPPKDNQFLPTVVDKLVKLYTREGVEEWVLIHVEVQGQYHKDFSRRMFSYYYRLFDKYQKSVSAYAIFTEPSQIERSNCYEREFLGTSLRYVFNTYKISQQSNEELLATNNPFALVVLAAKTAFVGKGTKDVKERDQLLISLKSTILKALYSRNIAPGKIRKIMEFLKFYVNFETREFSDQFNKQISLITNKNETMGIEEILLARAEHIGKVEGKVEEQTKFVKNLIIQLGLSDKQVAGIAEVAVSFVRKIRKELQTEK